MQVLIIINLVHYELYFISIDDLYILANLNNMLTLQSRKKKTSKESK